MLCGVERAWLGRSVRCGAGGSVVEATGGGMGLDALVVVVVVWWLW